MNDTPPAAKIEAATRADWLARVALALKGADFVTRLVSRTDDGIRVEPLYGRADGVRAERSRHAPWVVSQRIDHPDAARANAQAICDLEGGAAGLVLTMQQAPAARGFGLAAPGVMARALKDVRLDAVALTLDCGPQGHAAATRLAGIVSRQPIDPARLEVAFGMDPLGVLAQRGFLDEPWPERAKLVHDTVTDLAAQDFRGPFCTADGRIWHDAGATPAQELGLALAAAVAYLRALDRLAPGALARAVGVTLSADQDMFVTLAKFRAMRLLWSRVLDACGLPAEPLALHGETSWRMMARRDPHTNILRAVAGVFGAALGGASSICVLPFSLAQGLPDAFARRVARNSQLVLIEESQLWRIADPASGAGYVEHLTQALCDKAWNLFQEVERRGGLAKALEHGWAQGEVAAARRALAERDPPIVGSSLHGLSAEYDAAIEPVVPTGEPPAAALAPMRLAERFEAAA